MQWPWNQKSQFLTWKVPLQDTALEPSLLASSEDAVYQITLPLATTSPGQALEMTGLGRWEREFNRMSEPSLPCSPRPPLMQANTSTCQPGGFLSLLTDGAGPLGLLEITRLQTRARVEVSLWLSFSLFPATTRDGGVFRNPKAEVEGMLYLETMEIKSKHKPCAPLTGSRLQLSKCGNVTLELHSKAPRLCPLQEAGAIPKLKLR